MNEAELTPKQIVAELNKYIVGQTEAKKSVAIALRNRWRRKHLSEDMQDEIIPKNILLIGPTGVGKTEIARRLAKLVGAPFIKVEANRLSATWWPMPSVWYRNRKASGLKPKRKKKPTNGFCRCSGRKRL